MLAKLSPAVAFSQIRFLTTSKPIPVDLYVQRVDKARVNCIEKVRKFDPSSFLLAKFYPPYLQSTYFAIKALNIELSKVSMGKNGPSSSKPAYFADLKFAFWQEQIAKCSHLNPDKPNLQGINDPVTTLIADSLLKGISLDVQMLQQMVYSHKHYMHNAKVKGFTDLDSMCSFGEGTYSQMNYLMQSASLTPNLYGFSDFGIQLLEMPGSDDIRNYLSDLSAHLGQSTAICSFIIGLRYFAGKNGQMTLPIDVLARNELSQEDAIRMLSGREAPKGTKEKLMNASFEVTTRANDHILSARKKLQELRECIKGKVNQSTDPELVNSYKKLRKGLPDCLYIPLMSGIPTVLYLEKLQKCNFDVTSTKLQQKEWRLAWRSYWDYRMRKI